MQWGSYAPPSQKEINVILGHYLEKVIFAPPQENFKRELQALSL